MKETILQLSQTIDDFLSIGIRSSDWDEKPAAGKWSKKEIIGHLIDSAQINLQRFIRCTYEENFKLVYEQVEWVIANRYQEAGLNDLLSLWELLNRQIVRVLTHYPSNRLQAECDSSKLTVGLHTVEWLASDYVTHLKHHLDQIITSIDK